LGKWQVCAKWIPHMLNEDQRAMCFLLTITHLLCKSSSVCSPRGVIGQCLNSMKWMIPIKVTYKKILRINPFC
jgi:hypothetical protein